MQMLLKRSGVQCTVGPVYMMQHSADQLQTDPELFVCWDVGLESLRANEVDSESGQTELSWFACLRLCRYALYAWLSWISKLSRLLSVVAVSR